MRIFKIINTPVVFGGIRQDRNTVSQLKQDNPYDLNVPNQRRINNAIEELSKVGGEENVEFLLDVSSNLKYGTNINLGKRPYNDWREKLNKAAEKSLKLSDKSVQEKLSKHLEHVIHDKREYTPEEKEILVQRELLFDKIDTEALSKIKNSNIKHLNRNLNYFIISSEVPTSQKLYILKRLNFLMSDDYKINPQLADKKTQVLAEIVNDIVVNTPESKIPNIKAIDQKHHGMCGAISVSRKNLAYEDKKNYVDMVLSELDDTRFIQVYDRTKLGSKTKVPVPKANIDYDYALSKGYRIVDASVMNWMNVGDTAGAFNDVVGAYTTFDKENFGTFADSHIHCDMDESIVPRQDFYRALVKAKEVITKYKKGVEKNKYLQATKSDKLSENRNMEYYDFKILRNYLRQISPSLNEDFIRRGANDLVKLAVDSSDGKLKLNEKLREYAFVDNESDNMKISKIKAYIESVLTEEFNHKILDNNADKILELIKNIKAEDIHSSNSQARNFKKAQNLYEVAAAYRTQQVFQLDIPEYKQILMSQFKVPDEESVIIDNLTDLSKKIRSGKINPVLKSKLMENFASEISQAKDSLASPDSDEVILADVLDEYASTVNSLRTTIVDDLYASLLLGNRKCHLATKLQALQLKLLTESDKTFLEDLSSDLNVKNNKYIVADTLNKMITTLSDENCTDEQYLEIFNKTGHKSELFDLYEEFETVRAVMFDSGNENYIKGFNEANGAPADSPIETTKDLYTVLAKGFDNMSLIIKTLQNTLQIVDDNGEILNTADPKYLILKKLENMGELPTTKELEALRQRFNRYDLLKYNEYDSPVKFSQIPKDVTTFSNFEKAALKKYAKNINPWYSTVTRRLTDSYRELKEPLEELNRDIGVKTGRYWLHEGQSGLSSENSVKILEHMTDRPYYVETDGQRGIEKAKDLPYSLGSGTHVSHTEPSPHAQYVVDIKPVEIKDGDKTEVKDVIFHDNSWGAIEHENIWQDENGFTRTDYSLGYGGDIGFITDDNYRNGNLADNLFNKVGEFVPENISSKKYKKLNNDDEAYKYRMFMDFIVQGNHPGAQSKVSDIKLKLILPSSELVDDLTAYAKEMTRDEIKSAMLRISTAGESSRSIYKRMLDEIKGTDNIINKGITSKEDYDKLSDKNPLKIALEKAALFRSYPYIPNYKKFSLETRTMADINKLRSSIKDNARKDFDYIIAKNPDIVRYCAESSREQIYDVLKQFSEKNKLNLKVNDMIKIVNEMKKISPKDFDGSIDHSIDILMDKFSSTVKKYAQNKLVNPDEKIAEVAPVIRKILTAKAVVNPADIKEFNNYRNKHFAEWIDRVFNPSTDEEFLQILSKLRKMTTKEFVEKYGSTITDEDLNIKQITGYDIAKMIRSENLAARRTFINTVFMQEYYKDVKTADATPYFELRKFSRTLSGGSYKNRKRTFDDIYMDYFYSLEMLNLGKMFAKYKDEAFRKYGAFPAYPKVEISSEETLSSALDRIYNKINSYMGSIAAYDLQQKNVDTINKLYNYMNKRIPANTELTDYQYNKVIKVLTTVLDDKDTDPIYAEAAAKVRDLKASGSRNSEVIREVVNFAQDRFDAYSVTLENKTMKEAKESCLESIEAVKSSYVRSLFEPKYQGKAFEILNKWISAKSKAVARNSNEDFIKADAIYNQFKELFYKHRVLQTPEKLLQEYLLLCAKDTNPKTLNMPNPESKDAQEEYEALRSTYQSSLESLLYKADMMEMQEILMDCADKGNLNAVRSAFKNSTLDLKDGSVVSLDSEKALSPLINPMLAEENLDTAVLFLNQLGLSETVVNMLVKDPPFDKAYKNSDRIQRMLRSVDTQAKYVMDELNALGDLDKDPNYKEHVEKYKQDIIAKAKRTSYSRTVLTYETAIKEAFELFDKFPRMSRNFILRASVEAGLQEIRNSLNHNVDVLNQPMKILQIRSNLMQKLLVSDNSQVIEPVRKFFKEYSKLVDYIQSRASQFPNIGLYTED